MHFELRRLGLIGVASVVLLTILSLPFPGAARLGLGGAAVAQGYVRIDYFYDELDPYGEWVWHPRYGYVWSPGAVRDDWRPYTVGHWIYTNEYGWYWNSHEPFAWAVYHYGRWGYDPYYGWFWVPGDVWAPAWVTWRYSNEYVGWAPIGPGYGRYAYGLPVSYGPPVAESWVFVRPAYLTSRNIYNYAVPVFNLNIAFLSATTVYRPEFRGGVIYNRGIPRDQVVRVTNRPIIVQNVYRTDQRNGRYDSAGSGAKPIQVFAPRVAKDATPTRPPKRYVDNPSAFKAKAKLKNTVKAPPPKGWGPSAATLRPVTGEIGTDGFNAKKRGGQFGPAGPSGKPKTYETPNQEATGRPDFEGGPGKRRKGGQGGPGYPGGAGAYGDMPTQEATGRPDFEGGPGKRRKGGQGGPGVYGGPDAGEVPLTGATRQSGPAAGPVGHQEGKSKRGKPPCKQNPDLPGCNEDQ
jgi:hypothetical protein